MIQCVPYHQPDNYSVIDDEVATSQTLDEVAKPNPRAERRGDAVFAF